jgi:hypothetical protein
VPLIPMHGSASITQMKDLARLINKEIEKRRDVALYQFGDHDPMGANIPHQIENSMNMWGLSVEVKRVALTPSQVTRWKLPTRETKAKETDDRGIGGDNLGRAFKAKFGDSAELDSLTTTRLRQLVRDAIERHIDQAAWGKSLKRQARDQRQLVKLMKGLR